MHVSPLPIGLCGCINGEIEASNRCDIWDDNTSSSGRGRYTMTSFSFEWQR